MIGRRTAAALLAGGAWLAWRRRAGADLTGRVALVTGGSRGLGFLLAEELLAQGCAVAICGRDRETLERARAALREGAGEEAAVLAVRCDVADPADVAELVAKVVATYGQLDVLINNASTLQGAPLATLHREDFEEALAAGFWGMVHTTLEALPHLRRTGGRIANITLIGGKVVVPHLLPYDCAEFAAVGFSEGLRAELAGSGVTVTTVTAMSARRAATAVVAALRRGDAEIVLSWQTRLLRLAHALAPGALTRVMGVANRVLPGAPGSPAVADGPGPEGAEAHGGRPGATGEPAGGQGRWTRGRELRGSLPGPLEEALDRSGRTTNQ
ncbi:MAG TPA: SDR family NAD(P)-dependent oxidoreductase [Longimicrobiales bacterium]|nr:SDR family NAD(P)-dependent oxidoreductase [Longimicrobiales bacterium]